MEKIKYICCFVLLILIVGCSDQFLAPDLTPPAPPQGISTATGDNQVDIRWVRNTEPDLAGYHVLVSGSYDGKYEIIGTTRQNYFVDNGATNGKTYYYAVT